MYDCSMNSQVFILSHRMTFDPQLSSTPALPTEPYKGNHFVSNTGSMFSLRAHDVACATCGDCGVTH